MKVSVENAGKVFAVTIVGLIAGLFMFLVWAVFTHGQ
jgi:hypothetical protein